MWFEENEIIDAVVQFQLALYLAEGDEHMPKDDVGMVSKSSRTRTQTSAMLSWPSARQRHCMRDGVGALFWYRKAAAQGNVMACNNVGAWLANSGAAVEAKVAIAQFGVVLSDR